MGIGLLRLKSGRLAKSRARAEAGKEVEVSSKSTAKNRERAEAGQMTIEFVVAFPILIIVAVIAVNAVLFFSECAAFDNVFRDAVRLHITSPAYGQDLSSGVAQVESTLDQQFDRPYLSSQVSATGGEGGHATCRAVLEFSPTLFGMGLKSSVLGVSLPPLTHSVSLVADCYKPGVLL